MHFKIFKKIIYFVWGEEAPLTENNKEKETEEE